MYILGRLNRSILDHKGGSRPRRRLGRLKGTQRETLLKESHAAFWENVRSNHHSQNLTVGFLLVSVCSH